jgi:hypothetical protein
LDVPVPPNAIFTKVVIVDEHERYLPLCSGFGAK